MLSLMERGCYRSQVSLINIDTKMGPEKQVWIIEKSNVSAVQIHDFHIYVHSYLFTFYLIFLVVKLSQLFFYYLKNHSCQPKYKMLFQNYLSVVHRAKRL